MFPSFSKALLLLAASALPLASAAKERIIESKSLNPCQANSSISATLFNVAFTPNNRSLGFDIQFVTTISAKVDAELELLVYGYSAMKQNLNPCDAKNNIEGLCPMNAGNIKIKSNLDIPPDVMSSIPGMCAHSPIHSYTLS